MKRFSTFSRLVTLLSLLAVLHACVKADLDDLKIDEWQPEVAIPLINSNFSAGDIINKFETGGYIGADNNQVIRLVYTGELFSLKATDVITLPDIPFQFISTSINSSFDFSNDEKLTFVTLNSGQLEYLIEANFTEDIVVEWTIPTARNSSEVFKKTILLEHTGTNQLTKTGAFELDNYQFNLTGVSGTGFNVIDMRYRAFTKASNTPVNLDLFVGAFKNMKYQLISGFFGQKTLNIPNDSIVVDIFKNYKSGTVFIDNPSIELVINNSLGIPVTATITHMNGHTDKGIIPLTGPAFTTPIDIGFPDISQRLVSIETKKPINKTNSNIVNFLAFSPGKIDYGFETSINAGQPGSIVNHIRDSSKLEGSINLEIPFEGRIDHVVITDSFELSFSDVDEVKGAQFKLIVDNSFPLDAAVQIYFMDSALQRIDSLLPINEMIFQSGQPNETGIVVTPFSKETYFDLSEERFEKIKNAEQLVLVIELISSNEAQQTVKFLSSNFLALKLGVVAKLNAKD